MVLNANRFPTLGPPGLGGGEGEAKLGFRARLLGKFQGRMDGFGSDFPFLATKGSSSPESRRGVVVMAVGLRNAEDGVEDAGGVRVSGIWASMSIILEDILLIFMYLGNLF